MDRRAFLQTTAVASALTSASSLTQDERNPVAALTEKLNPTIQHAREVALSILKPSAKDLQHGLELHADSVVFDSYGFAPRAAIDDHVAKKFGPEHVAIGTDVAYTSQNMAAERKKVPRTGKKRAEFRSLWPDDDYVTRASRGRTGRCSPWDCCSAATRTTTSARSSAAMSCAWRKSR